ncbi:hypothetical protein SAMN05216325_1193 [Nitrosomonas marina]|uniref:Uncharacterized protein n=2 Tax=Nitrosomonas marina TaxID=917 RepID=A0A1H8GP49_9PROT|nr:hypothetical protein SAMN05216325_1193 [Nitrosomonas marina]
MLGMTTPFILNGPSAQIGAIRFPKIFVTLSAAFVCAPLPKETEFRTPLDVILKMYPLGLSRF